jgi:predicted amidohydrolase
MPVVRCEGTVISRDTTQVVVFGGVANHVPYQKNGVHDEADLVNLNLQLYKGILTSGANEKASFVVFPEFGLAPFGTKNRTSLMLTAEKISTISIGTYPCDSFTSEQQLGFPILYQMACFSRDAQIAGLVNMIDLVPCSAQTDNACPSDGFYLYNTNIGISAEGQFQVMYHKSHEYRGLTPQFNVPPEPDFSTWTVEGIHFGIFTCFDIFFPAPAKEYVQAGLSHFLYPVQMGLLGDDTAIQHWSKKQHSVIFASNDCLVGNDRLRDCSAVYSSGEKLDGHVYGLDITALPVELRETQDSVFITAVPI